MSNLMDLIEQRRKEQNRQLVLMALTECGDTPLSEIMKQMQADEDLLDAFMSLSPKDLGMGDAAPAPVRAEAPVTAPDTTPKATEEAPKRRKAKAEADDSAKPKKKRSTKKKAPPRKQDDDTPELAFNLRTEEGRDQYDAEVAKALRKLGEEVAAGEIRKEVGGSPAQVRAALDRLIDQGRVEYKGNTRSTRYWLAG